MFPNRLRSGQGHGEVHEAYSDACIELSDAMIHMCVLLACQTSATYVLHRGVPHLFLPDFFRLVRFHVMELSRQHHEGVALHADLLKSGQVPKNPIELADRIGLDCRHAMRSEPSDISPVCCPCGLCQGVRDSESLWREWSPCVPIDVMVKETLEDCYALVG